MLWYRTLHNTRDLLKLSFRAVCPFQHFQFILLTTQYSRIISTDLITGNINISTPLVVCCVLVCCRSSMRCGCGGCAGRRAVMEWLQQEPKAVKWTRRSNAWKSRCSKHPLILRKQHLTNTMCFSFKSAIAGSVSRMSLSSSSGQNLKRSL